MKTTKQRSEVKKQSEDETSGEKTPALVSDKKSLTPENQETSVSLSKSLAQKLMDLISAVNKDAVTPETVNASCNAASQIHKILKLNYEIKKSEL